MQLVRHQPCSLSSLPFASVGSFCAALRNLHSPTFPGNGCRWFSLLVPHLLFHDTVWLSNSPSWMLAWQRQLIIWSSWHIFASKYFCPPTYLPFYFICIICKFWLIVFLYLCLIHWLKKNTFFFQFPIWQLLPNCHYLINQEILVTVIKLITGSLFKIYDPVHISLLFYKDSSIPL